MSGARRTVAAAAAPVIAIAIAIVIIAAPASVNAYEFLCRGWRISGYSGSCPVGYQQTDQCGCDTASTAPKWYGAQLTMRVENQGGNGVTAAQFVAAAQSAAQSWTTVSGSNMVLNASQTFAAASSARWGSFNNLDDDHEIFFVTSSSEWTQVTGSGAGGTLGVTVSPWQSWGCNDRGFYDTDILINGFVQGGWSASWIESVILHEMGHSVGLGHPCLVSYLGCSGACTAVMAATGADYITPQQDDVNGISALYPGTPGGLGSACTSSSQCSGARPCITYQGFSYCSEACTGTCPTGYVCRNVSGSDVCVRRGAPAVGEACTAQCEPGATCLYDVSGGICRADCDPANDNCTGGARCVSLQGGGGACFPAGSAQQGEVCATLTDCAAGLICLGDAGGGPSTCWRQCDPQATGDCGAQSMCIELDPTTGYCIPAAGFGEDCSTSACFPGLICIGTTTAAECFRDCTGDPSICVPGESCEVLSDNVTFACFQRGTADEGDRCQRPLDCLQGLTCVGAGFGAECLFECNPQNPSCPLQGQTCVTISGSEGACDPAGGFICTCDVNEACVEACFCDQHCPCTCDTTERCEVGCNCDPECYFGCTCDTAPACEAGCSCDPDCASTCACDTGPGCEAGCTCDPACIACTCDISPACDSTCICDGDCPCTCDSTTRCDVNCACDPECYFGCTCDTTPACQSNCGCDSDCTTTCMCDVSSACDVGCSCDPNCNAVCGCDVSLLCDAGCSCDVDCPTTCICDLTTGCDTGCTCDPTCQAGCACNVGGLCESGCGCDPDCPNSCACDLDPNGCDGGCACDTSCTVGCVCDVTTDCDTGCSCDRECMGCPCDTDVSCSADCACDSDCDRCPCDATLDCDENCPCDYTCDCWCDLNDGLCDPDTNVTQGYVACSCDTADCPCDCDRSFSCNDVDGGNVSTSGLAQCACDLDCLGGGGSGSGCNGAGSSPDYGLLLLLLLPLLRRRRRY